ncbi:glycosyl transferase [Desulfonema limicola]|nr:glycosyl transferase [Desulfonema limicola]
MAVKKGWMAFPVKERWHKKPTALMGGIAIYISTAFPLFFISDPGLLIPYIFKKASIYTLPPIDTVIWAGMTLLFILGLLDDFIRIKPQTKLVGQILAASFIAFLGFRLYWFSSLTLDTIVTIIWIVGITNAFNLLDNMDGLCTGIAFIGCVYFILLFSGHSMNGGFVSSILLAGALAGFLVYNFHPASIFMGDCGSLMIGFVLSMLGIHYSNTISTNALGAFAVPVMIMMVPILDTSMVTFIRLLSGRKASAGGKDHTSHRLVIIGFSEKDAVMFLFGIGAVSGLSALFVSTNDSLTSPAVIIPFAISIILMGIYMAQIRVYPEKEFCLLRNHSYTPILVELTYKRQLALVVLDFCLIAFSYYLSYRLSFNFQEFSINFKYFLNSLPVIIGCKFLIFFAVGIYRGIWRYMSSNDVFVYIKASIGASVFSLALVVFIFRFENFSYNIFFIDWMLTTGLLLGTRGSFRISLDAVKRKSVSGQRVLIYGAGRGGEILLREIINNKKHNLEPVGLIDDDVLKTGKKLQGYLILGTFDDIPALREKYDFNSIIISFNGKEPNNLEGAKLFCKNAGMDLKRFAIEFKSVDL